MNLEDIVQEHLGITGQLIDAALVSLKEKDLPGWKLTALSLNSGGTLSLTTTVALGGSVGLVLDLIGTDGKRGHLLTMDLPGPGKAALN